MSESVSPAQPRPAGYPHGVPPLLALEGVSKYFPGVVANENVSLAFYPGEIHALLGENGAGKSTLMNIVTGLYRPDRGELVLDGYGVSFDGPDAAIAAGIGMVHQHFKLVPRFTIAENLALGRRDMRGILSRRKLVAFARREAEKYGFAFDVEARVETLSAPEQQRVEIVRVLGRGARLLILDEPTAVLGPSEVSELYAALRRFRADGGAVILISHKLEEIMALADRVTVLRRGRVVATHLAGSLSPQALVAEMIGHAPVEALPAPEPLAVDPDRETISLRDVTMRDESGRLRVHPVSCDIFRGEIFGIGGVTGNGQVALAEMLAGLRHPDTGRILVAGQDMTGRPVAAFVEMGIGYVPQDRLRQALAPALGATENAALRVFRTPPVGGRFLWNEDAATRYARLLIDEAGIALADPSRPVRGLSGGNQQRLVLARESRIASRFLVACYPGRGLDLGAMETMRSALVALRNTGRGVVLVSEDLDELLALSDRIAVMSGGQVKAILGRGEATREDIGALMSGHGSGSR
ncbi:ABC transporter ATP-binding protein [Swaminathania salitolerans]|uniref:ABC transporter n=1 Tax=Swaminathania salitolerans TaxID=182838 RepID=A0A511BN20_9PROT|nr:ABC transporter ATP-binding protein [Swaminathania salitolerans]GBQ13830.1 D-methionine ABC transporter ATP-binding protein [Swaminathania salitolerans LMG 21291]GEL01721.1 ABC transporter [Swaminathania salitolerans]